MWAISSREMWQETTDGVICKLNEIMQSWENRITLSNLRISERFAAGGLRLLVHFTVEDFDEIWAACFERENFSTSFDFNESQASDRDKHSMLVSVVKGYGFSREVGSHFCKA
jgi:hypothetical protein